MENQKKNNKGFSLVELIVVVAIMAVLMGVLVPTLVRNVEKSKKQKDINNLAELRSAIQTTMASEAFSGISGTMTISTDAHDGTFTIKGGDSASFGGATACTGISSTSTDDNSMQKFCEEVLANLNGGADYTFTYTSKLKDSATKITFTFSNEKVIGSITVTDSSNRYYSDSPIQLQDASQSSTPSH